MGAVICQWMFTGGMGPSSAYGQARETAAVPTARVSVPDATPDPMPNALKAIFWRPTPVDLSATEAKRANLGRRLFFDPILSAERDVACASCHRPEKGFADGLKTARGRSGQPLVWHTPTVWNLAEDKAFFWNGRVDSLEAQARDVIAHPAEMGLPLDEAVLRLAASASTRAAFAAAFAGRAPDPDGIVAAIAAYIRTLRSPETRFDRFIAGRATLTADQARGFEIFTGKGRCLGCHGGWRMTDGRFHDIGLPSTLPGKGGGDSRAMKTPGLRGLTRTAPYMHDGSLPTLRAVINHYAGGRIERPSLAPEIKRGIVLDANERRALEAFLLTL